MVHCKPIQNKDGNDALLDRNVESPIILVKRRERLPWTVLVTTAGLLCGGFLLTALIFWPERLRTCYYGVFPIKGNENRKVYVSPHGYTQEAIDYASWVRGLPHICGIDCLSPGEEGDHVEDKTRRSVFKELQAPEKPTDGQCTDIPLELRFDCYPGGNPSQSLCEKRGCCWQEVKELPERNHPYRAPRLHKPTHGLALEDLPLNIPYCYYPRGYDGYSFVNFTSTSLGDTGFLTRNTESGYPGDVPVLKMDVFYETQSRLRIRIVDPWRDRWETPVPVVPEVNISASNPLYSIEAHLLDGTFTITRKSSGLPIFDSRGTAPLTYSEQFLQLSTRLPSDYIYGLGEHLEGLLLDTFWKRRVLWNLDQIPEPGKNLYGSHPFYLAMEPDGNAHGVFLLNSNAIDVVLQPTPALTMRVIGGIIDLYVFLGPTPNDVISQYTEVVGRPFLPPYWSLGYHQCRFGYGSVKETETVWQRTRDAGIPFDVQWNDIDYMDQNKDFTFDQEKYKTLPDFVTKVHMVGMHYVPIIDPGISAGEHPHTYPPWDEGFHLKIFVRNISNMPFIGKVWNPVATTWPDFTHPKSTYYWARQILRYHGLVEVDGMWIDMNEPSNFWSGKADGCRNNNLEHPPFLPAVYGGILFYHTICMSARHYAGSHYNVHNLYGITETISSNVALQVVRGQRPFIISRSTFPGQGRYGGHWTGDVWSDWFNLWQSIAGILNFNMFGIPMVGADICGFNGNTTRSLCLRWMQLGAFYPFSRNHNTDDAIDQDPVAMGEEVVTASRNALTQRYTLLPYLYSLFYNAHLTGRPVARPLFFEFYKDMETYSIDTQFLWGPALMIVPALQENVVSVRAYIPDGRWYDWYTGSMLKGKSGYQTLAAPLDKIPLLVRGGYVLPTQEPSNTTTASRRNSFGVVVAPDESGEAVGELYWDDGDDLSSVKNKMYTHIRFLSKPGIVSFICDIAGYQSPTTLGYIYILGVKDSVSSVYVAGKGVPFSYDEENQVLSVIGLSQSLRTNFTMTWKG